VPVAALRGRRVSLSVASDNAMGLQLAYVGTVQRAPALRVRRFLPAAPGSPAGAPIGVVVTGSLALAGVRVTLEQRRGAAWQRVGAALLKRKDARVKLTLKLPPRATVRAVFGGSEAVAAGTSPVRTRRA
jgi:hypothetical protein